MSDKQWYSAVNAPMSRAQKKALLKKLQSPEVLASLRRPEMLMDFFTDCHPECNRDIRVHFVLHGPISIHAFLFRYDIMSFKRAYIPPPPSFRIPLNAAASLRIQKYSRLSAFVLVVFDSRGSFCFLS